MKNIGIDIGTTSMCVVVVDSQSGELIKSYSCENDTFIKSENSFERIQNPEEIIAKVMALFECALKDFNDISTIGITGQMHGILYIDSLGKACSPLYIWQDARGDLPYKNGRTYAQIMSEKTGYKCASGFGLVTHFYNIKNNLVPSGAVGLTTIHDYLAMCMTGAKKSITHSSDAASLSLFDCERLCFDEEKISELGIDTSFLPQVKKKNEIIGYTNSGISVTVPIGDNQASFLGSVERPLESVLVNVGTGSQVSVKVPSFCVSSAEIRPMSDGMLLVGSSLCGGRAHSILEKFFRKVSVMAGGDEKCLYDEMDKLLEEKLPLEDNVNVRTTFKGTRENPELRAQISNLSEDNFTPEHLIVGTLQGIVDELYEIYLEMLPECGERKILVGSGNGIRKNPLLRKLFEQTFSMKMVMPENKEEAAIGAARSIHQ